MSDKCWACKRGGTPAEALRELDERRIAARVAMHWLRVAYLGFVFVLLAWLVAGMNGALTTDLVPPLVITLLAGVGGVVVLTNNLVQHQRRVRLATYQYQDAVLEAGQ